jgi:hypothetical protein
MSNGLLTRCLALSLLISACGSSPTAASTAPAYTPPPDPCVSLPLDPARGPGLFFPGDATDGSGSFASDVDFAVGAKLAVVTDTWSVPEEMPAMVEVTRSEARADGTFTIHFAYASASVDPMGLVGPIDPVTTALSGRLGSGLAPGAVSIDIPQVTYEVTLPQGRLLQKMVRCSEERYVEQLWLETEADADGPTLVSSYFRNIPPRAPEVEPPFPGRTSHIIYVHGAIVREQGPNAVSPEFGPYRFRDIVSELGKTDAQVHAPLRAKDSSFQQGVQALTDQITALLHAGVAPYDITVVGASEGGIMSLVASTNLGNDGLSFVILGACSPWAQTHLKLDLHGRILSIYEQDDPFGSTCSAIAKKSHHVAAYREIPLHTGLHHGFLFRPLVEWLSPTLRWSQHLDVAPWGP